MPNCSIGHVLGLSRGGVQARIVSAARSTQPMRRRCPVLVERRARREPLQHLTGRAAFRSLELAVGPGVFVPRPETEQVAQLAIDALRASAEPEPIAVDLGTGSGAIALALATEVPHARVWAVENSPEAFMWTRRNVDEVGAENLELVFVDLATRSPELDGTRRGRHLEPALCAGGRDPARPRGAAARSRARALRRSPTASTSCAPSRSAALALLHPGECS